MAALTINVSGLSEIRVQLNQATIQLFLTGGVDGQELQVIFEQDGVGGRLVTSGNVGGLVQPNEAAYAQTTETFVFNATENNWTSAGGEGDLGAVGTFIPGVGTNSQVALYQPMPYAITFPAGATGSQADAKTAATGSTTYTFLKNGSQFGSVNFAASGTVGTFTLATATSFAIGDILEIDGPSVADATLANIGITLVGTKV